MESFFPPCHLPAFTENIHIRQKNFAPPLPLAYHSFCLSFRDARYANLRDLSCAH